MKQIGWGTISEQEVVSCSVLGNLPDRPAFDGLYHDGGYTSDEIKAQFDALPRLIVDYFNAFVEDIAPLIESGKLPEVESDDEGAFLSVVDGRWQAVKLPSAEGVML